MNYRKLKKQYIKKFHVRMMIEYFDKSGKKLARLSKIDTARKMKQALYKGKPYLGIFAK